MTSWKNHGAELLFVSSKVCSNIFTFWLSRVMHFTMHLNDDGLCQTDGLKCRTYSYNGRTFVRVVMASSAEPTVTMVEPLCEW